MLRSILCACAGALAAHAAPTGDDGGVTCFVGVDVVRVAEGDVLSDQVVVVRDGRIEALGPVGETQVPEGARVVDGEGAFLAPGLADMHVHLVDPTRLVLFLANGVTTVRDLFGNPFKLQLRAQLAAGEALGPALHTAGPIIDGDPPVWSGSDVVTTTEEAVAVVRAQHEAGYDFLKVYERLSAEVYEAIVSEAARLGIEVHGHVPQAAGLDLVLESGQSTIEHLTSYGPALARKGAPRPAVAAAALPMAAGWTAVDAEKQAFYADWTAEAGTWNCPTLVVTERAFSCPDAGWHDEATSPGLGYVGAMLQQSWGAGAATYSSSCEAIQAGMPGRYAFVKALHEAGAGLLIGTDTPNPWVVPGFSIHGELAHFVAAGLTPAEVLRIATLDAARFLQDDFGDVRTGLRADLVLLAANPLEDLAAYREPLGVMVRGRWLPREELDGLLEALGGN
jgi:imidazolonepropionase-like amidohydrolase